MRNGTRSNQLTQTCKTVTGSGVDVYEDTRIGVVIPVYNEAPFIGEVIESVPAFIDRVYVIDDASTDGSWAIIREHAARSSANILTGDGGTARSADGGLEMSRPAEATPQRDTGISAVRHVDNRGRGGAVKTGYKLALEDEMDIVAVIDGDGQMDGDVLDEVIEPVYRGEAAYAKGNRLVSGYHWEDMSTWRLFGNVVLTLLTKIASGYWTMRDPQNGFTAIAATTLEELSLEDLYHDYGFLNDLLIRLGARKKPIVDVPMRAVYEDEESGIEYTSFVPELSALLLRMFCWRLWVTYGPGET